MSADIYTFLGTASEPRVAAAANTANLLAAAGDDVALLDLQPRTPPPPLSPPGDAGLADVLAGERPAASVTKPVEDAPTASPGQPEAPVVFGGGGGVSLLPFSKSLTPVVVPDDDPADAAARLLDDLGSEFDAVCAVAPPLPDLVGLDRLWVATLNRTTVRSERVVGVLDPDDHEAGVEALREAERGGVQTDCTLAVQPTRRSAPPTVVRDPEYPLRGRVPAAQSWPAAAADAYREFVEQLTDRSAVEDLVETPPTLLDPGTPDGDRDQRVVADGAGGETADRREPASTESPDRSGPANPLAADRSGSGTALEADRSDDGWTLGGSGDRDGSGGRGGSGGSSGRGDSDASDSGGRLRGLFR